MATANISFICLVGCLAALPVPAMAQDTHVADIAADAFGAQTGVDRIGLYSENAVRGFDLQQSGAYRIEDHYFARASGLPESLMDSLNVDVGISAATLALPSPSGVVVYRLRQPDFRQRFKFGISRRDFGQAHADAQVSLGRAGGFGLVAAVVAEPVTATSLGQKGYNYDTGLVASFCPAGACFKAFASRVERAYDGDAVFNPTTDVEPPHARVDWNYAPAWAKVAATDSNAGLLFDGRMGRWALAGSLTASTSDARRSDVAVLDIDGQGAVHRTTWWRPRAGLSSTALELRAAREFERGDWKHVVGLSLRGRQSDTDLVDPIAFDGGDFALRGPEPDQAQPVFPTQPPIGLDTVSQTIASLTWRLDWKTALDIRAGLHASNYRKTVRPPSGPQGALRRDSLFVNGSVIWQARPKLRLFASYVSGPEESGVAPSAAGNRGEGLAPVEARQWEVGATYALTPGLNLILSHFDITKPVAGLRQDGVYTLVGDVRHTGDEISLSGNVSDRTSIVLGAVALQPRLSGDLVTRGAVQAVPAGVSRLNVTANIDHRFSAQWSADAQLIYEGPRRMRADATTEVDGVAFLTVGATRNFPVKTGTLSARLQLVNALADLGYYGTSSNALYPVWGRTFRVILSRGF